MLDRFGVTHPVLSLTEIAERADLPLSTMRRLIAELQSWGGLVRLDDGRYQIGMRLWSVGALAPEQRGLREAALPYLNDLFRVTQENVLLTVLDGVEALCIEKVASTTAVPIPTHVGTHDPLHTTGVGKSILAFSRAGLFGKVVDAGLVRRTSYSITEPGRLAITLDTVRRSGVAYSYQEMSVGAVSVAAPIISRRRTRPRRSRHRLPVEHDDRPLLPGRARRGRRSRTRARVPAGLTVLLRGGLPLDALPECASSSQDSR